MTKPLTIVYGGWFQRTTLHLSEIYDYLMTGGSKLDLNREILKSNWKRLGISAVSREVSHLEYVKAVTKSGIEIKYYEDGLYTLTRKATDIVKTRTELTEYFTNIWNPAISYIFSLGAPTPKILANIKTVHPVAVAIPEDPHSDFVIDEDLYGQVYSELVSQDLSVQKTPNYIFITYKPGNEAAAQQIIDNQIFFREFKDQLEKYLDIHRRIWEEISEIKDRKEIRGTEVAGLKSKLDRYQKTISLISNRINQMSTYIKTRQAISKNTGVEKDLVELFNFKFETLVDTLEYIKEIWKMTTEYLNSAIRVLADISTQTTNRSIQSLTMITSLGVVATLITYLSRDAFPVVRAQGTVYLIVLISAGLLLNTVLQKIYQHRKYKLNISDHEKKL